MALYHLQDKASYSPKIATFCRAMLCKRGLCCHAVSVRPFVRLPVTFVHSVKTSNRTLISLPSGNQTTI